MSIPVGESCASIVLFFVDFRNVLPLFSAHNLSVSKRDRLLFDNINFSVDESEILYVKGPNGAGKTSLLRVLTGLVVADQGQVFYRQVNITEEREDFNRNLIYFGHLLGVNSILTARENLAFWCTQHQVKVDPQKILTILAVLGLVGLEDMAVHHLSAGQQRRVALARFWLKEDAQIWILDEPFTALDVQGVALLNKQIIAHLQRKGGVIMTSHQELDLDYPTKELILEYRI
ncbi:MAG: heme exporter protein A [Paraglaciecola sp.]|jgi:heme exporter protein A